MTVVIYARNFSTTAEVLRLTSTQVVVRDHRGNELRYRRDDGRQVGNQYGGGELRPLNDPQWLAQRRELRRKNAVSAVHAAAAAIRFDTTEVGRQKLLDLRDAVDQALNTFDDTNRSAA